jgi:hypothetical protein
LKGRAQDLSMIIDPNEEHINGEMTQAAQVNLLE